MAIRIAVVDRRRLVREGLAAAFAADPGIEVVAVLARAARQPGVTVDAYLWGDVASSPPPGGRVLYLTGEEASADLMVRLHDATDADADGSARVLERSVLTRRETQVIDALAEGLATGEIGRVLGIATKSVDNHKQRAYAKLGVHSAAHAVATVAGAA